MQMAAMTDQPEIGITPPPVKYDSKENIAESMNQVRWCNIMDKGPLRNSSSYKKINVLMLRWADKYDNLDVTEEVDNLKNVFETDFGYSVTVQLLTKKEDLQVEVNLIVARWVHEHNAIQTLLIVYYAGHGRPGLAPGELRFHGHTSPNDKEKGLSYVIWNKTEQLLRDAEKPDVLEIFDCCYAGFLGHARDGTRTFEYIAATQHDKTTRVPGKDSFTSALIWALKELKPKGRFTTVELLGKIKNAPYFPRDQEPVLRERESTCTNGRIMLHPLGADSPHSNAAEPEPTPLHDLVRRHTLTLHFELSEKMDTSTFDAFGNSINDVFARNTSIVAGIRWGGIRPSGFARAVEQFQIGGRERRLSATTERSQRDQLALTPTSMSTLSPFMSDAVDTVSSPASPSGTIESSQESQDKLPSGKRPGTTSEDSETSEVPGQRRSHRKRSRTTARE